jgi:hypothetical protein
MGCPTRRGGRRRMGSAFLVPLAYRYSDFYPPWCRPFIFPRTAFHPEIKRDIKSLLQTKFNIQIPSGVLPSVQSEASHEELSALFEWVGLACLGSQRSAPLLHGSSTALIIASCHYLRLHVNDAASSYVASYDPPAGSSVGDLTHPRWTGFLTPAFVHSILNEVLSRYVLSKHRPAASPIYIGFPGVPTDCSR